MLVSNGGCKTRFRSGKAQNDCDTNDDEMVRIESEAAELIGNNEDALDAIANMWIAFRGRYVLAEIIGAQDQGTGDSAERRQR